MLVDATNVVVPCTDLPRDKKMSIVRERVRAAGDSIDLSDINSIYHEVVNPGLRRKAEHAIKVCTGTGATDLIMECFDYQPREMSLYAIRNSINHGTVDVDELETWMVVEARFPMLSSLVRLTLNGLLQTNLMKVAGTTRA